jgi:hypothetical protein
MNFIGHLLAARWESPAAAFGLGAMLPDFASMAGMRVPGVRHSELAAGVAHHHRTDHLFHDGESFVALQRAAFQHLLEAGVERGPARAVAHIGVELLIDGLLLQGEPQLGDAYLSALAAFEQLPSDALPALDMAPLTHLQQRLMHYGIPYDYADPALVTARLIRILGRRPRLALSTTAAASVGSIMPDLKERVVERLPALLDSLAHGLAYPRCSTTITG